MDKLSATLSRAETLAYGLYAGRAASSWGETPGKNMASVTTFLKFGHNPSISTAAWETVWPEGGLYAWPAAATTMTLSSDDVNDTSAGSGAQTVGITGYDAAGTPMAEIVGTMNGQTGVTVTPDLLRGFRLRTLTAGATLTNEGNVYLGEGAITSGKPAVVYALIAAPTGPDGGVGPNRSQLALWTTPAGTTTILTSVIFSSADDASVRIKKREPGELWEELITGDVRGSRLSVFADEQEPPVFPGGTDIEMQALSLSGATVGVGCWFTGKIITAA